MSERPMIKYLRETRGTEALIGVEIGVAQAHNARSILENLNMKTLYLIDPYAPYLDHGNPVDFSQHEQEAHAYLRDYVEAAGKATQLIWIKSSSTHPATLARIPLVDFVYIDGNHTYEQVKKDILAYWPKVKKGGIIGGHDYVSIYPGVVRAVNELIPKEALQQFPADWWLIV